ncbi:MAG: prepilin-type N-terminal cleavage/methylation domain-containing protein [Desulfobacterales bacterium]|nr:prepilin-type N-terminal cleavage/methylation domain-containing protein [Desulfobacterales bacterium]
MEIIARNTWARGTREGGFTLIELMMAMTIMMLVMSAIMTTFRSQTRSWVAGQEIANMQQNLRAGMYYLERSIRMAGYDPQYAKIFGFESNLPWPHDDKGATTNSTGIAFTVDLDGMADLDTNSNEQVAYRHNPINNELEILDIDNGGIWTAVAENISAIAFNYLDANNNVTTILNDIRAVQITLTAQSDRASVTSTRSITSRVRCRNK